MNVALSANQEVKLEVLPTPILDIEQEFVNHLTNKESVEYAVRDGLSSEMLYQPKSKSVWIFVQHYLQETKAIPTQAVLLTEFPDLKLTHHQTSIEWLVEKLRERYQRNKLEGILYKVADNLGTPSDAMDLLTHEYMEIQRNSLSQQDLWGVGSHDLFLQDLQDDILAGMYHGVPVGFDDIDEFTGGLKPGHLAFLVARPKRQKTFFLLNSFIQQKRAGAKPILFTLENTVKEVKLRISCMLSGYPWDLAYRGIIDAKGWKVIREAWEEFDALGPHWIASPPFNERTVPQFTLIADKVDADSILISQFKWIQPTTTAYQYKPDHEKWASLVLDLKQMANQHNNLRPVFVEAQLNREGERIEDFTDIGLGQMGLTDQIGQTADVVFALYQNKDMFQQQHIQIGIVEARNYGKKNWYVHYEFKNRTYMELV